MELVKEALGAEGEVKVDLVDKKIVVSALHKSKGADVEISIKVSPEYLLDKVKEKIPGPVDNAIIDVVKAILLK